MLSHVCAVHRKTDQHASRFWSIIYCQVFTDKKTSSNSSHRCYKLLSQNLNLPCTYWTPTRLQDQMCHYYYLIVRWRDCEKDPKHTGSIEKEYTCEEAEKTGNTYPNPTEMPWQSGTTSIKGPCYKCGKPFCRKSVVRILTRYSQFHLRSLPSPSIIFGDYG